MAKSMASNVSWGKTTDRAQRTAKAREAAEAKFLEQADGDPDRAKSLRKAHFQKMQLRSLAARKARKADK